MKKMILVVDDEPLMLNMVKEMLSSDTVEVSGVLNGEEALKFVNQHDVDMVLTDIMMPKLLGTKLFFELKKADPFIQIVIMTGYPTLQNIVEMLEAGASDFVIKPFDIDRLKNIVFATLDRIDRWRDLRKQWLSRKKGSDAGKESSAIGR
jgi:DNA-binding NtrC family response regulator